MTIHILWWNGNFMGWSTDKEKLHEWAKNLDPTWESDDGEGTNYSIETVNEGFDVCSEYETFEIRIT